jgi:UDP-N-acetylglucosamine--N-acetylmuramyl-(pentapeptide) pyrophosphoryl-undecaprenol N-acetylglucosamine transferase
VLKAHHEDALVDTGMPIEPPPVPRPDRRAARARWNFPADGGSVLLVYCGSQGSLAINRVVADWVSQGLPEGLMLLWTTGRGTYEEFKHLESPRVRVCDYQSPASDAYAVSDLALARAGATTTAELLAWGIPAVLVPLPTAAADHQTTNAAALEAAGAAIHVPQSQLSTQRLDGTIRKLLADPAMLSRLVAGAAARARPNAASEIARRILAVVDSVSSRA